MRMTAVSMIVVLASALLRPSSSAQDVEAPWRLRHEAGLESFEQGRYSEAARSFRAAVREAEDLGPGNYRLAESLGALSETSRRLGDYEESVAHALRSLEILQGILHPRDPIIAVHRNNLAETYVQLGRAEDAEPLYRQSLPILETALGGTHPDVVRSVDRLAAIATAREAYDEAIDLYERLLSVRWGGSAEGDVVAVLDSLAALLVIAQFPDSERDDAARVFFQTLSRVRPPPVVYIVASRLLLRQRLIEAAEDVMRRAVETFPGSRGLRTEQAELYAENQRLRSALDAFGAALQMDASPGVDPDVDARERRILHVRIGHMHIELGQFDEAVAAFQRALEIAPDAIDARLELAGQYLVRGMLDEAQAAYARVIAASPETVDAYYGLSELYLRMDRFAQAADAAGAALRLDPEHQRARYTRVRALARAGRDEEGRRELAEYERRESAAAAADDREVQESAINRSGAAALVQGNPDEAIALFQSGIEAYPDAALIYLNLGVALEKQDRPEAAVATFQAMLDRGCCAMGDSYLVHWSLAVLYRGFGDDRAARHRVLFLREYDRALAAALDRR